MVQVIISAGEENKNVRSDHESNEDEYFNGARSSDENSNVLKRKGKGAKANNYENCTSRNYTEGMVEMKKSVWRTFKRIVKSKKGQKRVKRLFGKHRNISFEEDDFNKRIVSDAENISVIPKVCNKNNIFNSCYAINKLKSDEMIKDIPLAKVFLILVPYI